MNHWHDPLDPRFFPVVSTVPTEWEAAVRRRAERVEAEAAAMRKAMFERDCEIDELDGRERALLRLVTS